MLNRKQLDVAGTLIKFSFLPQDFEGTVVSASSQAVRGHLYYLGSLFKKQPFRHFLVGFVGCPDSAHAAHAEPLQWKLQMAGQQPHIATSHQAFAALLSEAAEDPALHSERFLVQFWHADTYRFKLDEQLGNHLQMTNQTPSWRHLLGEEFREALEKRLPAERGEGGAPCAYCPIVFVQSSLVNVC